MQNFRSNIKSINEDTLFNGFRAVIRDNEQSAFVTAGKIGSLEVKPGVSVLVYGTEGNWVVQAAVMTSKGTRLVASAECDSFDL